MKTLHPWEELKNWLTQHSGVGAKAIAMAREVEINTVYRWARGERIPSAADVIAIYRLTRGQVHYKTAPIDYKSIWPEDMFKEINEWRVRND